MTSHNLIHALNSKLYIYMSLLLDKYVLANCRRYPFLVEGLLSDSGWGIGGGGGVGML